MPAWKMRLTLPCIGTGARTTCPPNAWPIAWWPETDAEDRDLAGRSGDQVEADAGLVRRARAGGQHDRLGLARQGISYADLVVAPDLAARADIAQEVEQVEGE